MGVRGLFTYLTQQPGNFTNHELHNTYLVIDGINFSSACYREAGFAYHYGGEYLNFTVRVRAALNQFRKCRIKPIFVFDGCHECNGAKREKLLSKNTEFIKALSQFLNYQPYGDPDSSPETASDFLPRMIDHVFISVLKEFGMHYVTCEREADIHVAELACYLNCPVASNDSDFFLFGAPSKADYRVVPLTLLDRRCKPLSSRCTACGDKSVCYGLPCKVFRQSKSVFGKIHPPLLPLLPVLLGNDFISDVPWPTKVTYYFNSLQGRGLSYNGRRIQAVATWLSSFSQDVSNPVREILSLLPHHQLDERTTQIIACIRGYVLDLHTVCEQLAQFLSLKGKEKVMHGEVASNSSPQTAKVGCKIRSLDNAVTAVKDALLSEKVDADSVDNNYSFLGGWPVGLVTKFRQGGIITSTLDSLYVPGGAVFQVLVENLRLSNSVYSVTETIRRLEYGLFLRLEHKLGNVEKICGSESGRPVETRRQGCEMCSFELNVSPLALSSIKSTTKELVSEFLKQHLQLDLSMFQRDTTESLTLVCVLVFWFKHSHSAASSNRLHDSSVALAFISCSLIMSAFVDAIGFQENELESMAFKLADCMKVVADGLKEHCFKVGRRRFSIEIVHQLNELQLVFQEFQQLIDILDILSTDSSDVCPCSTSEQPTEKLFTFSPAWIMFPSGRLLHWLSTAIEASAPEDRLHQVKEIWIPRLLSGMPENEHLNCETLADHVTNLISSADEMMKA